MTIMENDNNIDLKFPDELTEDSITSIKSELETFDFKNKIESFKSKNIGIIIDLSAVSDIDFFGYQHLYGFCYFIKRVLNFNDLKVEKKSEVIINFEKKYGLFI